MRIVLYTGTYLMVYNRKPKMNCIGTWVFRIKEENYWFEDMTFADALKSAGRKAKELDAGQIELMP